MWAIDIVIAIWAIGRCMTDRSGAENVICRKKLRVRAFSWVFPSIFLLYTTKGPSIQVYIGIGVIG
jgi:hypothetical protein